MSLVSTPTWNRPDRPKWDAWEWCEEERIRVVHRPLRGDLFGEWHPAGRLIVLRDDLTCIQEWSTLAHECGHAFHYHVGCTPKGERIADSWAADKLISPEAYERAEAIYGLDLSAIATELGVMDWAVHAWRRNEIERRYWAAYFSGRDQIA